MISVIIPAYKIEVDTEKVRKALEGLEFEIIVEEDKLGQGKGITLQRGFQKATGELIVWLDADMQIHPRFIHKLVEKYYMETATAIVIGSKFHPLSVVAYSFPRKMLSYFGYYFIKRLFNLPIHDTQTGIKLFHRRVLEREWKIRGFGYDVEVLYRANKKGFRIAEVPVEIIASPSSTINLWSCLKTLWEVLWLRFQVR